MKKNRIFLILLAVFCVNIFASDFNENDDSTDEECTHAASQLRLAVGNGISGFCNILRFCAQNPKVIPNILAAQFVRASAQGPLPGCFDIENEQECLSNCCGWCASNNVCLFGNASGPFDDGNWNWQCPNLNAWNFTGDGCSSLSETQGFLILGGLMVVPCVFVAGKKLYTYYCWRKKQYEEID